MLFDTMQMTWSRRKFSLGGLSRIVRNDKTVAPVKLTPNLITNSDSAARAVAVARFPNEFKTNG
jgi:hypothetical protein